MPTPIPNPLSHLMIPGPTPLPDTVRAAMGLPGIGHRSPEFKAVLANVFPRLKQVFKTQSADVLMYTASGTGAVEAAMVNTLNVGDTVLIVSCGVFSDRWGAMAKSLGFNVQELKAPAGEANTVESLAAALAADTTKQIKAVSLIHSETSTGVLNPIKEMVALIRQHGALSIVDSVTGLTAAPFEFDEWGIDLAISGSQKGFMIPPGLSFLAVGPRAWEAHKQCQNPGFYFNFTRNKKAQDQDTTAYTPATHLILALDAALDIMMEEGMEAMNARHAQLQTMVRAGVSALGLKPFVQDVAQASPSVSSVLPPAGISVDAIRKGLKKDYLITVADGQAELKGKIFRIGHLGFVSQRDVLMTLAALEGTLLKLGMDVTPGAAVAAAQRAAAKPVAAPALV
jgi:aspartate aminotransferase-like enzyme